jgi:hypothetical protein
MRVLPAPPGEAYVSAGCDFYVGSDFDLDVYVRDNAAGFGNLTNEAPIVKTCPITIDPGNPSVARRQRMALADYVIFRVPAPYTADPDSGALGYPLQSLTYAGNDPSVLASIAEARTAIDSYVGCGAPSQAQIVVTVDAGRPSVVSELLSGTYGISGLYVQWMGNPAVGNVLADKVLLDVAFGIRSGRGELPVGLPASDAAADSQNEDQASDGQDATFVRGYGFQTSAF